MIKQRNFTDKLVENRYFMAITFILFGLYVYLIQDFNVVFAKEMVWIGLIYITGIVIAYIKHSQNLMREINKSQNSN